MVYVSLGRKKSATFLMIIRKVYKKREKVRIFKCYTFSPYFYGWVGNSVTISTAISSLHYTMPDSP